MSVLLEPFKIGNLEIRNRFIRSATYFALSDADGYIGQPSVDLMKTLAQNEVGLIMTGYAYVLKSGQSFPDMNGIQDDDHIPGYREMTRRSMTPAVESPCRSRIAGFCRRRPPGPAGTIWRSLRRMTCPKRRTTAENRAR